MSKDENVAGVMNKALGDILNSALDDWHPRALAKLDTLNFEGLDQDSLAWAKHLLLHLKRHDIKPKRIIRTAEATIAMWFKSEIKARIECCDDGFVLSIIDEKNKHTTHNSAESVLGALIAEEAKEAKETPEYE